MRTQIFVNLAVEDLKRSVDFFSKLGYQFNPQYTDENAACMIVSDEIFVMLLLKKFFKTFTKKEIADSARTTESIIALSVESREKVDELVRKALSSGGKPSNDVQDHGWMYVHSFQDPDGHLWETFYMDPAGMPQE